MTSHYCKDRIFARAAIYVWSCELFVCGFATHQNTVPSLKNRNATVTSRHAAGTAWLTAKSYKIFPIRFPYRPTKGTNSNCRDWMRWLKCPCTRTHAVNLWNWLKFPWINYLWGSSEVPIRKISFSSSSVRAFVLCTLSLKWLHTEKSHGVKWTSMFTIIHHLLFRFWTLLPKPPENVCIMDS
jgi:hypothetical protein